MSRGRYIGVCSFFTKMAATGVRTRFSAKVRRKLPLKFPEKTEGQQVQLPERSLEMVFIFGISSQKQQAFMKSAVV